MPEGDTIHCSVDARGKHLFIRCGTIVRSRGQGEGNRTTYWCPGCQT